MEPTAQSAQFASKCEVYLQALHSFTELLAVDLSPFDAIIVDGLKNGLAKKFEYTAELAWNIVRRFLLLHGGVETNSPKSAIREFHLAGHISESDCESLMAMMDDRNRLLRLNRADELQAIIDRLPHYAALMGNVGKILEETP